ncbi:MAG: hypothetical protein JNJ59_06965 [Deltaproteobacteria bacterium]|nr:hypothetical protein [Deltaproteobacteria bacterium]
MTLRSAVLFLTVGLAACGSDVEKTGDTAPPPDTTDTSNDSTDSSDSTDVEPDTNDTADTADTAPDTTPDTTPDTADTAPDSDDTADVADVADTADAADTADVADTADTTDVVVPPTLVIKKGDRCADLATIEGAELPFTDAASTVGANDDYVYTVGAACGGSLGQGILGDASPDLVYQITPAITATYRVALLPAAGIDLGLMLTDKCPPIGEDAFSSLTCLGASDRGNGAEWLRLDLTAGKTYYLLVDGFGNDTPSAGAFTLEFGIGENCVDGIDNDGNSKTDCADSQCDDAPQCNETNAPNGCANGIDDDGDGKTDCADSNCDTVLACDESRASNGCANGIDDDGNGKTDCEDGDCASYSACLPAAPGDNCSAPVQLALGTPVAVDTCPYEANYTSDGEGGCTSTAFAPDLVYSFKAPRDGSYRFSVDADWADYEMGFNVVKGACPGELLASCIASGENDGDANLVGASFALAANDTIYAVVGATSSGSYRCGDAIVSIIEVSPEVCTGGIDEDGDGKTDCGDSDCRGIDPACPADLGDSCGTPILLEQGVTKSIETCSLGADYAPDDGCEYATTDSPDGLLTFVAPTDGTYFFDVTGETDFDVVINAVVGACPAPGPLLVCAAGSDRATETESLSVTALAGDVVWLIVSGYEDSWGDYFDCGQANVLVTKVDAEVCTDNIDNDRDGKTDCADTDCASAPRCNEAANGDNACGDGVDNDTDGFTDCSDRDCAGTAACPNGIPGDGCLGPLEVTGTAWTRLVDTCTLANDFAVQEVGGCQQNSTGVASKDVLAKFVVPQTGAYRIEFRTGVQGSSTYDALLNVVKGDACPASPVTLCTAASDSGNPEAVTVGATAGETLWIIAGGYSTGCGKSTLTIGLIGPEICDDAVDNDIDGKVDCADTDCAASPLCNEGANGPGACSNEIDEDGDGYEDCFDPDCKTSSECPNGLVGDACAGALVLTGSYVGTFNTCGYTNDFQQASNATCKAMGSAGDILAQIKPEVSGDFRVKLTSGIGGTSTFDSTINVVQAETCPVVPIAQCLKGVDDVGSTSATETLTFSATAGQSYWVIGDGYSTGCGTATLTVTQLEPEICDDLIDNDGDGFIDCADSECRTREPVLCPAAPGDSCATPSILPLSTTTSLNTCDAAADYSSTTANGCRAARSKDLLFKHVVATTGSYKVTLISTWLSYESVVNVVKSETCPTSPLGTCLASSQNSSSSGTSTSTFTATAGDTLWLVVGSNYSTTECGDATLRIEPL